MKETFAFNENTSPKNFTFHMVKLPHLPNIDDMTPLFSAAKQCSARFVVLIPFYAFVKLLLNSAIQDPECGPSLAGNATRQ